MREVMECDCVNAAGNRDVPVNVVVARRLLTVVLVGIHEHQCIRHVRDRVSFDHVVVRTVAGQEPEAWAVPRNVSGECVTVAAAVPSVERPRPEIDGLVLREQVVGGHIPVLSRFRSDAVSHVRQITDPVDAIPGDLVVAAEYDYVIVQRRVDASAVVVARNQIFDDLVPLSDRKNWV